MSLQDELTETTVEDKMRRLATFFTTKSFDDINMDFDLAADVDNADPEYFKEMMAGALTHHFKVPADAETIGQFGKLGELANYVNEKQ